MSTSKTILESFSYFVTLAASDRCRCGTVTAALMLTLLGHFVSTDRAAGQTIEKSAAASDGASAAPIVGPLLWQSTDVLIRPVSNRSRELVSLKDPTVVYYKGKWHMYATTADAQKRWSMVYLSFKDWSEAADAKPYYIDLNPNLAGYHCAPQVFYFRPHKKWYLIYQSQHPQYSTTDDLSKPSTWTTPKSFFPSKSPAEQHWADYWVICDKSHAYMFFTAQNGRLYRSRTRIEDFPRGMSEPKVAIEETPQSLFQGSMTYKMKGTDKYLMLVEGLGPSRYYRAYTSSRLDDDWTPIPKADSYEYPFAGLNNVAYAHRDKRWTWDVGHAELIRDGYDETLTVDPKNLQMVFQGLDPGVMGPYQTLPYQLGLLELAETESKATPE
jgi:hypothetical protein